MRDNLVSVITPAYKAANVIRETIASVQAQTYTDWEMLITEDCGPDETRSVVREIAAQDHRVKLLEPDSNGGPAAARNHSLSVAKGRWVAFLDSDDLWLPAKLQRQLAFQKRNGAVLTFTGYRRIDATGTNTGRYVGVPDRLNYRSLLGNTAILTSTVRVDRMKSGEVRMKDCYYDDFACWLDLLRSGGYAAGLDEDLTRYRVLEASVSRDKSHSAKQVWKTYREIEGLGPLLSTWYFANYAARAALKYRQF